MTDRELDWLVAERVMGWRRIQTKRSTYGGRITETDWYDADIPDPEGDGYWTGKQFGVTDYPRATAPGDWEPTGDISAAWSVVEQMRELGWHIDLDNDGSQKIGAEESWTWNALLWTDRDDYDGDGDGDWPTAHADTAPRAICLAALRAVGVEVES